MLGSNSDIGSANLLDDSPTVHWVGMCLFRIVLFEMSMKVSSELFERCEHFMLNKISKCLIIKIKHEIAPQSKKHIYSLGLHLYMSKRSTN